MTVDITRPEWSDELAEALLKSFGQMQEDILLIIAERLEQLTELSPEELAKLAESAAAAEYLNDDMRRIKRAIRDQDRNYAPQIAQIYDKTEVATYKLAERYFSYRSIQISTVKNRSRTRELIAAMQKQKVSELLNLSHTYCYDYDGKVQPIGKTYRKIVNQAVNAMASSGQSYQKVLRKAMHQLSESGIKTLYWDKESGRRVARRADSHIRMNIAEGVRRLNQELQEINGKIFNADGVEVSLHHLCAPDHQPIQGRQFDLDDWERINGGLKRPIGTLNCGHHISYIIRAAARPAYTEEERQAAIDSSNEEVEYNGKKMTRYEASQRMRAKERKIRAMRSEENALKAAGDTSGAAAVKRDIRRRTAEYKKFCSDVGLEERMDKTYDFGFIPKKKVDFSGGSGIIKPNEIYDLNKYDYIKPEELDEWKSNASHCSKEEYNQIKGHRKPNGERGGYIRSHCAWEFNAKLRKNGENSLDEDDKKTLETIRKLCKENTSDRNVILDRYVESDYLNEYNKPFDKYHESTIDEAVVFVNSNMLHSLKKETAIVSASYSANVLTDRSVHIRLFCPKGTHMFITDNTRESEVIFHDGLTYEIISCEKESYKKLLSQKHRLVLNVVVKNNGL